MTDIKRSYPQVLTYFPEEVDQNIFDLARWTCLLNLKTGPARFGAEGGYQDVYCDDPIPYVEVKRPYIFRYKEHNRLHKAHLCAEHFEVFCRFETRMLQRSLLQKMDTLILGVKALVRDKDREEILGLGDIPKPSQEYVPTAKQELPLPKSD